MNEVTWQLCKENTRKQKENYWQNHTKISGNDLVKNFLLPTGGGRITAANTNDRLFRVGYGLYNPRAWDTKNWTKSHYFMGQILEDIRSNVTTM